MDWLDESENLENDFNSLKHKHTKDGFREGISQGQDYILQAAFNEGFKSSGIFFEKLSHFRGKVSAIYMFLMNQPAFVKETGDQFEALITKLEDFENNQSHIDKIAAQNNRRKTEERDLGGHKNTRHDSMDNTTIDTLIDGFDNMQPQNDNCSSKQKELKRGCSDCNCKEQANSSPSKTHDTSYIYENSQNIFDNKLKGDLDEDIGTIKNLIGHEMTLIMTNFDSDTKNQIIKCLKSIEK